MASVLQKATPPRELDFDLSQAGSSPTTSVRQFMRRSQSFSGMSYSPTEHQQYQEYQHHQPHQPQVEPTGFPTPVTPTRSHQGVGAASLHTPYGTTMQGGHESAVTRSDSKYSSQTVASRSGDQRRARQQRRKTDCSDEIQSMRRPSTSHASSPPRKVAYSQYPDFESISDPFAKRDKIPQKSERPFLLDVVATPTTVSPAASELKTMPQAARGESERGSVNEDGPYTVPLVPVRSHSQKYANIGDSASRNATTQSNHTVAALSETSSGDPSPGLAADAEARVPTPLKTRDRIPRHTVQPAPSPTPSAQQRADEPLPPPLRSESMNSSPSKAPVTPTKPRAATGSSAPRSMGKSLLISSLVSPASPNHPANSGNRLRAPGSGSVSRVPPPLHHVDSEMSVLSTSLRPFSDHNSSPRLQIDMDKVETLYERRSIIFELNKSKIRDRSQSTATSPLGPQARSPATGAGAGAGAGLLAMVEETEDSRDGEHAEEAEDQESEHFIPFDQVLIPTAFKRLRTALEDPAFEIDEETYRRFKLSERWYSREEQVQMERAFTKGTFGASKKRSRIIQKRLSDMSADSNALGHGHAAVGDMSESYRGLGELPTPPASAMSLNDQHHQRLESLQEEEQEPPATGSAVPERRRTRSSRRPSHRQHHHHNADNPASSHRQVPLPGGYVPPPSMGSAYATQPETHVQGAAADSRLQQQQPASNETSHQDSRHRNSRHHRPAAQPSPSAVEQTAKSSGGCCGCTIM